MAAKSGFLLFCILLVSAVLPGSAPNNEEGSKEASFPQWLKENRTQAEQYGISPATIAAAFRGIRPLGRLLKQDRKQAEYSKTFFEYLHGRVSNSLISNERARIKQHRTLLAKLEAKYGVPPEILVALWGLESGYGAMTGNIPVIDRCPEHSGLRWPTPGLLPARTSEHAPHSGAGSHKTKSNARLLGQSHGTAPVHTLYLSQVGSGRRW